MLTATRRTLAALLALALVIPAVTPLAAGRKAPLTTVPDTAWTYSGLYRVKAKRTGLDDFYTLEFVVDFFSDGFFTLQNLPIEEGAEEDFFSGTWSQVGNKVVLEFDLFSIQLLEDFFEADFADSPDFENVEVFVNRWALKMKIKRDRTGSIFMKFKEKLRHFAISDGIRIKVKTNGKGEGDFFEDIAQPQQ